MHLCATGHSSAGFGQPPNELNLPHCSAAYSAFAVCLLALLRVDDDLLLDDDDERLDAADDDDEVDDDGFDRSMVVLSIGRLGSDTSPVCVQQWSRCDSR